MSNQSVASDESRRSLLKKMETIPVEGREEFITKFMEISPECVEILWLCVMAWIQPPGDRHEQ